MPRKLRTVPLTPEDPPSAEAIRDKLLRAAEKRAEKLVELAEGSGTDGCIGVTEDGRPIMFPAYELQSLLRSVSEVADGELRELRAFAKLTPAERQSIKDARAEEAGERRSAANG